MLSLKPARGEPGGPNCGVSALAIVANIHFNKAWSLLIQRKKRKSQWKGSTWETDIEWALTRLGIPFTSTPHTERLTVRRFAERIAQPGQTYLLFTGTHALVLRDDVVIDNGGKRTPFNDKGRVRHIFHILDRTT
jgi:hypothetical protein